MEYELIEHQDGMKLRLFVVTIHRRQTHFHDDIEIFTPLEGDISVSVSNRRVLVRQGDFFIVNRNEAHSLTRADSPNMLLVVQFSPNFCKSFYPKFLHIDIRQRHITPEYMPRLHRELRRGFAFMVRCMSEKKEAYRLLLMSELNRVAWAIMRYGIYETRANEKLSGDARNRARINGIVDYIQRNFMNKLSLGELARQEKLDATYLSHYIKGALGVSFREYVGRLRLEYAADLILNTKLRLIDVCMECGYSDYRYLNNAFVSEFGLTPTQFREQRGFARSMWLQNDENTHQHMLRLEDVYDRIIQTFGAENTIPSEE